MNVLGLHAFYHNHAAALICDDRLTFFSEEEKLSRVQGVRDGFPSLALAEALRSGGLRLADIDEIAYPMQPWRYARTLLTRGATSLAGDLVPFRRRGRRGSGRPDVVSMAADRVLSTLQFTPPFLAPLIRHRIRYGGIPGALPPIRWVPHHRAHAASAFYTSGMEEATVVILDGMGEVESTSVWHGRGTSLELLRRIDFPNSLGEFYAAVTEFVGFETYRQEGKLMGLAAYGNSNAEVGRKLGQVLRVSSDGYQVDPRFTVGGRHSTGASYSDAWVELMGAPRGRDEDIEQRHRDIAYAAQDLLERAALAVVQDAVSRTKCRRVCISGGVAMNCKMNGHIEQSDVVDELWVLPAGNDAGAALGAAMERARSGGADPRQLYRGVYTGYEADEDEMERAIRGAKLSVERWQSVGIEAVAREIADGRVVGFYSGRAEHGARALGARSILADPRRADMSDLVNHRVKQRESWRPFAPVVLAGFESEYFVGASASPHMMKAYAIRADKRAEVPAVVHVDGTCRPQTLTRETNPVYFDLVEAFYRLTGVPMLLNTSFNVRGEPIVSRPVEALRCYAATGLDVLVLGPFWLRKSVPDAA